MAEIHLSSDEKASLTSFARKLVERNSRAFADKKSVEAPDGASDQFSGDGLLRRVLALEEKLERSHNAWRSTVDAILVTVERLETKGERAQGEAAAFREAVETIQFASSVDREDMMAAVEAVVTRATTELAELVGRLEATLARAQSGSEPRRRD